jgi:four helix bundle protein
MHQYSFENLEVWKLSKELAKDIYQITSEFPNDEKYGMISQLRRAAISVSNNLVEGSARKTMKDQANFTTMSYSSLLEVLNMLIISVDLGFVKNEKYKVSRTRIEELSNKLNAYRNSQLKRVK